MALRNQPYLPLYVKDFLTDEKLIECSAEATGVYIRLMCIMHSSENYGQLKLSDKYNDEDQIKNYSNMLVKQMPYAYEIIYKSLEELLKEKVIFFDKNILTQKRMFNDGLLSEERAKAGKKGGKHSKQNASKTPSKNEANTEYEYEDEIIKEFNSIKQLSKVSKLTKTRKDKLNLRIKEIGYDKIIEAIKKIPNSSFLIGNNERNWKVDFDWLITNDTNILKILEGKYESEKKSSKDKKTITPEWLGKDIESTIDKTENIEFKEFIEEFRKE